MASPSVVVMVAMPKQNYCALPIGRGRAERNTHLPMISTHTQQSVMIKCSIFLADSVKVAVAHGCPRFPSLTRTPTYGKKLAILIRHDITTTPLSVKARF